ncbi:nuclear transport factor 2 family protein [Dietzia sp. CH92]|uniref:nuclear transport factor 2 family protein n=1 Tax=Dietzia sp. CH92 TaxID=3051823 RepID=UPI0028D2762F|nr:nuclear transport factor 2 family protein [Dietzia sp. CH92]
MDLEILAAEREIARALARFARAMDEKDWPVLHEIMLPGATAELGTGTLHGPVEVVDVIRSFLDNCGPTQHLLGTMLIDVDIPSGTATSRTYVADLHLGIDDRQGLSFSTFGDYHDEWQLVGDAWRMSHRTKHMNGTLGDIRVFGGQPDRHGSGWAPEAPDTAADVEAIRQLKARYFRFMDTKDWDGLASVFTEDVEIDMTESGGGITRSRDEYIPFLRASIENVETVHHGHTPEISISSPASAIGTWAMEDKLWWPDGSARPGLRSLHGYGHYTEEYRKTGGGWKISAMRLSRLRVDTVERAE